MTNDILGPLGQAKAQITSLRNEMASQVSSLKKIREPDLKKLDDTQLYVIHEYQNLFSDFCTCCENSLKNIESVRTSGIAGTIDRETLIKSILEN